MAAPMRGLRGQIGCLVCRDVAPHVATQVDEDHMRLKACLALQSGLLNAIHRAQRVCMLSTLGGQDRNNALQRAPGERSESMICTRQLAYLDAV